MIPLDDMVRGGFNGSGREQPGCGWVTEYGLGSVGVPHTACLEGGGHVSQRVDCHTLRK